MEKTVHKNLLVPGGESRAEFGNAALTVLKFDIYQGHESVNSVLEWDKYVIGKWDKYLITSIQPASRYGGAGSRH